MARGCIHRKREAAIAGHGNDGGVASRVGRVVDLVAFEAWQGGKRWAASHGELSGALGDLGVAFGGNEARLE